MPYKISGTLGDDARVIIIKESDWSIESNTEESSGSYEVDSLASGYKWVIAEKTDGEVLAYGYVDPIEYTPPCGNRGVFAGGYTSGYINAIEYITITSLGNSTDFGDLTNLRHSAEGLSNAVNGRGIFGGGFYNSPVNNIEYITILSLSDSTDFGDLTIAKSHYGACSNGTSDRGVFGGARYVGSSVTDIIDYITISTPSDATDFGNMGYVRDRFTAISNANLNTGLFAGGYSQLNIMDSINMVTLGNSLHHGYITVGRQEFAGASNGTNNRGVFAGGNVGNATNVIDTLTVSAGNATDFGDLLLPNKQLVSTSNGINDRAVFAGGVYVVYTNAIEYVTITSAGNATDFGDLSAVKVQVAATSNA